MFGTKLNYHQMTKYREYLLQGLAIGAADVVPGVSGGNIAFITVLLA